MISVFAYPAAKIGRPAQPARPLAARPRRCRAQQSVAQPARAFKEENGNGGAGAHAQEHMRATKMINLCNEYFNELMSNGNVEVCNKILSPSVQHKDMVRNEGRSGIQEYQRFVRELKAAYPDIYVKPTQFGVVDDHTLFVAFEGRATPHTPVFKGVDLFCFNDTASKIKEVQVYRSNWLGAQGHEERKRQAQHQPSRA